MGPIACSEALSIGSIWLGVWRIFSVGPEIKLARVQAESETGSNLLHGCSGACGWHPQVGLVYVLDLWFLHKTS